MRLSHLKWSILLFILSGLSSLAWGQSNSVDRATDSKPRTESTHTLAEAAQSAADSPTPEPPYETFAYKVENSKNDPALIKSRLNKKNYYKTVNLLVLSRPSSGNGKDDNFQSNVSLGLNNPYYNFKKEIRVVGSFDL